MSNESWEIWFGEFPTEPPFPLDKTTLLRRIQCVGRGPHLPALGWPAPVRILDLFAEFCDHRNGRDGDTGRSLLAALAHYGLNSVGAVYKQQMIDRILKGAPFTAEERREILDYCW